MYIVTWPAVFYWHWLTCQHWETGKCFRKVNTTKGLRWIYLKHPDKGDRCTSALWNPCRPCAVWWVNECAALSLYLLSVLSQSVIAAQKCKSGRQATQGSVWKATKNCMLWPSHTLYKSLPAIVTSKSLTLPDSIHLDHNLSTPIGSNRRFCLRITQSTTFKISFYSPGKKQRTDRLKH